jgi:hemin uptake protein HemP
MFENPSSHPSMPVATDGERVRQNAQRIDSRNLLAGSRELVIDHAGQSYRLRLTRNDKLILTK